MIGIPDRNPAFNEQSAYEEGHQQARLLSAHYDLTTPELIDTMLDAAEQHRHNDDPILAAYYQGIAEGDAQLLGRSV